MPNAAHESITIRDINSVAEMRLVEQLEKEVWGLSDLDVVPMMQLVAAVHAGGVLLGAFDGEELVGLAYGFVGIEREEIVHHSHMLAVKRTHRNLDLGRRLKLAQRERVLQQNITRMTWTFDPLQALNAHFNFRKLGAFSDKYIINFYGESTASFLHRNGTDRLWMTWPLDSRRVKERIAGDARRTLTSFPKAAPLLELRADDWPRADDFRATLRGEQVSIEIPTDIGALEQNHPEIARAWREETRRAFTDTLSAGYVVTDFHISERGDRGVGVYLLDPNFKSNEFE